jgi:hypothetical protein
VLIYQLNRDLRYAESSKPNDAIEFLCRSAANGQKRRTISAAGRNGQDRPKRLINNQIPDAGAAIFKAKTQFSAVGSGIGEVLTRAGEARLREIITAGSFRYLRHAAETPFSIILEARP